MKVPGFTVQRLWLPVPSFRVSVSDFRFAVRSVLIPVSSLQFLVSGVRLLIFGFLLTHSSFHGPDFGFRFRMKSFWLGVSDSDELFLVSGFIHTAPPLS